MKILRIMAASAILLLTQTVASAVAAPEYVGSRKIIAAGCHNVDGTCFVSVDGPPFGASAGCATGATNEFRFDNGDTPIGRRSYASILATFLSGRTISFTVQGCTGQGAPALLYFQVTN